MAFVCSRLIGIFVLKQEQNQYNTMQTFEEILQQEMAQPVRIKGSDATVTPQQAMIKSVMANAMKGDLSAILFLKQMTRPAETDGDRQHQTAQQQLLADTRQELSDALTRQGLPPTGYDVELELLARQVMTLRRVAEATDMPRYQVIDIRHRFERSRQTGSGVSLRAA